MSEEEKQDAYIELMMTLSKGLIIGGAVSVCIMAAVEYVLMIIR